MRMVKTYKIVYFDKCFERMITMKPREDRTTLDGIKIWLMNNDYISDAVVYDTDGSFAFEYDEDKGFTQ